MSLRFWPVIIARGPHPFPSRTRSLSLAARMVLPGRPGGRVRRRRPILRKRSDCLYGGRSVFGYGRVRAAARPGGTGRSFSRRAAGQQSRRCARWVQAACVASGDRHGRLRVLILFTTTENGFGSQDAGVDPRSIRCSNRKRKADLRRSLRSTTNYCGSAPLRLCVKRSDPCRPACGRKGATRATRRAVERSDPCRRDAPLTVTPERATDRFSAWKRPTTSRSRGAPALATSR